MIELHLQSAPPPRTRAVYKWTNKDVLRWLADAGFACFADKFRLDGTDGKGLMRATLIDLIRLGIVVGCRAVSACVVWST